MRGAVECPAPAVRADPETDPPRDCLERIPVTLSGPWHTRGPGSSWHLLAERDGRLGFYTEADLTTAGSRRLSDDTWVEALLWEGTPVAIDLPSGSRVETDDWGHSGWLMMLFLGMFAASGLPMLLEAARLKRGTTNSWWSVRGEQVALMAMTPLMRSACLLGVPSMLGLIPLALGLHLRWVVLIAVLGFGLVIYAIVRSGRAARRRPAGDG
jgi:hypothetical protein